MRHLIDTGSLSMESVTFILDRAEQFASGAITELPGPLVSTIFLTPSMRTRMGFQVAAIRLGGQGVTIDELRLDGNMSASEPVADAVRVVAGMSDVVVTRTGSALPVALLRVLAAPIVNGGDGQHHPTQGLIDVAAVRRFAGDPADLHIALCGDLGMRSATSFLALLAHTPPARLSLMHPEGRAPRHLPDALAYDAKRADPGAVSDVDVLVMVGLPPGGASGHLGGVERGPYVLDGPRIAELPESSVVLSPMPVVDEITDDVRTDPRIRMFDQSDHAVYVRMAVLEWVRGND